MKKIFPLFLSLFLLSSYVAESKILDPNGKGDEKKLLLTIAPTLDSSGIDVVLGDSLSVRSSIRPRIASLSHFKIKETNWGTFSSNHWAMGFSDGIVGVLVAVKPRAISEKHDECVENNMKNDEDCNFVKNWLRSDPDKRIFLAFAAADTNVANRVKSALERKGYVVFVFQRQFQHRAWADPSVVGEVFAQASHRLVLDTVNTRKSEGVAIEVKMCEYLLSPAPAPNQIANIIKSIRS